MSFLLGLTVLRGHCTYDKSILKLLLNCCLFWHNIARSKIIWDIVYVHINLLVINFTLHKIYKRQTHTCKLLGLERDCITLEACVPPTPGTNGEVLFLAI